ncbi:MAG: glycosyltransferase family 39 protein [Deltaproteobacteria bacterium]|nr:glycosyltransferase family 39 protein [Deltaproteobacteria bacterium]
MEMPMQIGAKSKYTRFFEDRKYFWFFLIALTVWRLIYIFIIPITPQEAYYWYYSKYPALSYFDHPPMAAYSIWLGTHLFGNTIFGVKFMGVLWGLLTNILLYFTTLRAVQHLDSDPDFQNYLAFMVVILFNLTIFAHLYSVTIMPDTPLMFFWLLTIYFIQEWIISAKNYYWLLAGLALGLGMVSKYTAIALVPAFFVYLLLSKKGRRQLVTPWPYLALIIVFVVFSPVIYWNAMHNWASFIFQFGDRAKSVTHFGMKYFGVLIGSQLFLLTPFIFVLFFVGFVKFVKCFQQERAAAFFYLTSFFIIGGFTLLSFETLIKMNWLLPGYLGVLIATALINGPRWKVKSRLFKAGVYSSLVLIILAHLVLLIPNIPLGEGNTWSGWKDAAQNIQTLQQKSGGVEKCFIFTNSYKSAALLKFYLPDQQDTYCKNVYGQPALQFAFWPLPNNLAGKDAIFVFDNRKEYNNDLDKVNPYFDSIELLQKFEYKFLNKYSARTIYCYYARNYHLSAK